MTRPEVALLHSTAMVDCAALPAEAQVGDPLRETGSAGARGPSTLAIHEAKQPTRYLAGLRITTGISRLVRCW